jgi:hypothetical protein
MLPLIFGIATAATVATSYIIKRRKEAVTLTDAAIDLGLAGTHLVLNSFTQNVLAAGIAAALYTTLVVTPVPWITLATAWFPTMFAIDLTFKIGTIALLKTFGVKYNTLINQ